MEATKAWINAFRAKSKQATLLCLEGFREACCLHRVLILCHRSRKLMIRTGQCFLLNGFIFLGSIIILNSVIIPTLHWILPDRCPEYSSQELCSFGGILKFYSFLRQGLVQLFHVTWFYTLYVFSIILSNIWYNDIAKYGFSSMGRSRPTTLDPVRQNEVHDWYRKADVFSTSFELFLPRGICDRIYTGCWDGTKFSASVLDFVLTAMGSEAEQVISSQGTKWEGAELGKLPIFNAADNLSMRVLSLFPLESQEFLQKKKDR